MASYLAKFTPAEKKAFGQRLRQQMVDAGINGADLARAATKHLKKPLTRQLVSSYASGVSIPEPINLRAIELALKIPTGTLLTRSHEQKPGELPPVSLETSVQIQMVEGGKTRIIMNAEFNREHAQRIMEVLREAGF